MAQGQARGAKRPVDESKRLLLEQLSKGRTVKDSLKVVGRSIQTYEAWRKNDPEFRLAADRVRQDLQDRFRGHIDRDDDDVLDFAAFSERYFGQRIFPHQQNIVDLLEGSAEPSWLHPSMTFERGEHDLVMVNMPPEHAKSTTITMNYVAYRIAMDPNIRVMIVSKTQAMARKFLFGVKSRLTHDRYADMHARYGPPGGYNSGSESWTQDLIYISGSARDSGEKDPTCQALGVRGHIFGSRCDLIVLDDVVDGTNAHEYEKQIDWIQSEVISRISSSGSLLVVGTRLASKDLYLELRNPARYPDEVSPWTYLAMPAVLELDDEPAKWTTLWPKSNHAEIGAKGADLEPDEEGLFPKWDGPRLAKKRARMQARTWAMVYMQSQVSEDAIFNPDAVGASINGQRTVGNLPKHPGTRSGQGMDGVVVVAGLDPATTGHTAAVVIGLDTVTQRRYVMDVFNRPGMKPDEIRELIKSWSDRYGVSEWRIEKNGFQGFLVHDREVNEYCAARGTVIRPHFTGSNKHDADFGVASMTTLWNGWEDKHQLIELPSTATSEGVKALVEQLVTWSPDMGKRAKTDAVMALWFAELACRDRCIALGAHSRSHRQNPFLTPWDQRQQQVVSLLDMEAKGLWAPVR